MYHYINSRILVTYEPRPHLRKKCLILCNRWFKKHPNEYEGIELSALNLVDDATLAIDGNNTLHVITHYNMQRPNDLLLCIRETFELPNPTDIVIDTLP